MKKFRSGYVAILGAPNVGKSTLLNCLLKQKISIVSSKPQTTRQKILGIHHEKNEGQILFLDSPGLHESNKKINQLMVDEALQCLADADVIYWLIDSKMKASLFNASLLEQIKLKNKIAFLMINKIDLIKDKSQLLSTIQEWQKLNLFKEIFLISALKGEGCEKLIRATLDALPEGPAYYPEDQMTSHNMRFMSSEVIREKIFELSYQEIPYSVAVVIDEYEESEKLHKISATIYVEKKSQKPILIGKGGSHLKKIGQAARLELEQMTGAKVFLKLFVKVVEGWTEKENILNELGFGR